MNFLFPTRFYKHYITYALQQLIWLEEAKKLPDLCRKIHMK